jgi:benzoyl-CoA reductase/2-hydroxyglutaryl-CoA dehydratase subunit BcrC/BadD/HgdB
MPEQDFQPVPRIAYCNPFVPVEWIAAHGWQPLWLRIRCAEGSSAVSGRRGVCPFAAAVAETLASGAEAGAVVLTTTCDQLRYAASWLEHEARLPVFVMHVPSTWQTAAAQAFFLAEVQRLGRFLVHLGGTSPSARELAQVMVQFDAARAAVRQARRWLPAKDFAAALVAVRESATATVHLGAGRGELLVSRIPPSRVPLAMVGGPLVEQDYELFEWVERAGGQIVLDATEWGERTLPRPFATARLGSQPVEELADAYFGSIPDVFRRPNDACYEYLTRELAARQVRGLIVRRYLWCDLWHAEVARLQARMPVPVLDLDVAQSEDGAAERTRGRIEAFLETLS